MIDIENEELLTPKELTRHPIFRSGGGGPGHISKVYRAFSPGALTGDGRRVRLETIRTPRGLMSSRQALSRFVARLSDPDAAGDGAVPTTAARRREALRVDQALDDAGIV